MYQDAVGEPDDGNGQGPGQADQLQGLNGNTTNDDQ
jgi:hypothetical protein